MLLSYQNIVYKVEVEYPNPLLLMENWIHKDKRNSSLISYLLPLLVIFLYLIFRPGIPQKTLYKLFQYQGVVASSVSCGVTLNAFFTSLAIMDLAI